MKFPFVFIACIVLLAPFINPQPTNLVYIVKETIYLNIIKSILQEVNINPITTASSIQKNLTQNNNIQDNHQQKEKLIKLAKKIAKNHGIYPPLFVALIEHETKFNPYALHLSSPYPIGWKLRSMKIKYSWYKSGRRFHYVILDIPKWKAVKLLKWAMRKNYINYDVGIAQINKLKLRDYKISPIKALTSPELNLTIAAKIFKNCLQLTNNKYFLACECYHKGENTKKKYTSYSLNIAFILLDTLTKTKD